MEEYNEIGNSFFSNAESFSGMWLQIKMRKMILAILDLYQLERRDKMK